MTDHPLDDLGAFALDALDPPERDAVAAHVAACASCAAEVERYRRSLWAYASVPLLPLAPTLRDRVVARARGAVPRSRAAWSWRSLAAVASPVLAIALVVSVVLALNERSAAQAYARALASVASGRVLPLEPTAAGAGAQGALVIAPGEQPQLVLRVPDPPSGKTWEAWVLRGDRAIPAGLSGGRGGVVVIQLTTPPLSGDGVAVTLEAAEGAEQPTSPVILQRGQT